MNLVGDPAAIRRMSSLLNAKADQLDAAGRRVRDLSNATHGQWECARAERFRATMEGRQSQAHKFADGLHSIANELDKVAASVQRELDRLHSIERRVRSALSTLAHNPALALLASEIGVNAAHLPAPGDPAWDSIARRLHV